MKQPSTRHVVDMQIYMDNDGLLEVTAEVNDEFDDYEVFECILASAFKYAEDTEVVLKKEEDNDMDN